MTGKRLLYITLCALGLLGSAPNGAPPPADTGFVVVCPVSGEVDDGMAVVIERAVREAKGARALILEIDTPGGRVDSAIDITNAILNAPCETIAYVKGMGAISAGALIAYSCKHIIMAPGTNIGASAPIILGGAEPSEEVSEKTRSFLRAKYRALAEKNGHPALLGEAMVDAKIEVRAQRNPEGKYVFFRPALNSDGASAPSNRTAPEGTAEKVVDGMLEDIGVTDEHVKDAAKDLITKNLPGKTDETYKAPQSPPQTQTELEQVRLLDDGTELVSAAGELLTLTSNEAARYGLIPTQANTLTEVINYYQLTGAKPLNIVPTWSEILFRWLTSPLISGLLLMFGIGGLYLEFKMPGAALPAIVGISCLTLFFGARLVIGMAEWIDILLLAIGLFLLALELFVIPGFGFVGIGGIACIITGVYLALTRVAIPEYEWDFIRLEDALKTMVIGMGLFAVFVAATWKLLPRTPLYRWMVLTSAQDASAGFAVQTQEEENAAIGLQGVAVSVLRPAGRGRFNGKNYDVVTRGEYLDPGTPIEIIQVEGNRRVVKAAGEGNLS